MTATTTTAEQVDALALAIDNVAQGKPHPPVVSAAGCARPLPPTRASDWDEPPPSRSILPRPLPTPQLWPSELPHYP